MQVSISSFEQAVLLAMVLVGVRNEPQGPAYLPPSSRPAAGGGGTGHPDDWAGVSMYYGIYGQEKILSYKKNRHDNLLSSEINRASILFLFLKYNFYDTYLNDLNKIDIGSGKLRVLV